MITETDQDYSPVGCDAVLPPFHILKVEAAGSFETVVSIYQTAWHLTPEDVIFILTTVRISKLIKKLISSCTSTLSAPHGRIGLIFYPPLQ
jgi:hypothetical protein